MNKFKPVIFFRIVAENQLGRDIHLGWYVVTSMHFKKLVSMMLTILNFGNDDKTHHPRTWGRFFIFPVSIIIMPICAFQFKRFYLQDGQLWSCEGWEVINVKYLYLVCQYIFKEFLLFFFPRFFSWPCKVFNRLSSLKVDMIRRLLSSPSPPIPNGTGTDKKVLWTTTMPPTYNF